MSKYFPEEDVANFNALIFEMVMRAHISRRPDESTPYKLYHYTTMGNLPLIIQSGVLWATHIATMNDSSEVLHTLRLLRSAISRRMTQTTNSAALIYLHALEAECRAMRDVSRAGIMVTCFSERGNDLSQWRAYGGPICGAAIKIKAGEMLDTERSTLLPVVYNPRLKREIMDAIVVRAEGLFMQRLSNLQAADPNISIQKVASVHCKRGLSIATLAAPIFKHSKFHHEQEWRLVTRLSDEDAGDLQFVPRATMVSVHLPLRFDGGTLKDSQPMLPIQEIIVGPTAHPNLHRMVAAEILRKKGHDLAVVKITSAKIPFRPSR